MKLITMKMIAMCAILFLVLTPNLHVVNAQSAGLLACITSIVVGGGDLDACCLSDVIDEAADLIGLPIVADTINSLTSLCCAGNLPGLEESCCVEALIGAVYPGEPIISACCGADTIHNGNNQANCCAAIPTLELCVCDDPSAIVENPDVCCAASEFTDEQYENCCALDTYNDSTRSECCNNELIFGEGTTIENCCDTPARIEANNLCCTTETFNQVQRDNCCDEDNYEEQIERCCPAGVDNLPEYCGDGPEPPGPKPPKPPRKKHRLSKVINHQQLDIKTVVNVPFNVQL